MPHPSRTIILLPDQTVTVTTAFAHVVIPEQYTAVIIRADVLKNAGGTAPTLDIKIQQGIKQEGSGTKVIGDEATGSYVFDDWVAFTQVTATSVRLARVVGSGEEESAAADGTLTAGQIRNGPIGSILRVKAVLGGTSPNFNLGVIAQFIP